MTQAISGLVLWARKGASDLTARATQNLSPYVATATQYASAGKTRALQAWEWTRETATRENANAAASRVWQSTTQSTNAVVDATVPTFLRQATAPTLRSNQERINAYHRELNTNPAQTATTTDFRPRTDEQRALFARNISEFVTLKTIYEFVCGLTVDPTHGNFYNNLMDGRQGLSSGASHELLKYRFFEQIDMSNISIFRKWAAYLTYYILSPILYDIIETVSADLLRDIRGKIEREAVTSSFGQVGNMFIECISGYLETLSSAYGRIRNNPYATALDPEVSKELNNALRERGYTQETLNRTFTEKFVNTYSYTVKWTTTVDNKLKSLQFADSSWLSLLNYPIKAVTTIASWIVWAVLYIPQTVTNYLLAYVFKTLLNKVDVVDAVVSNSVSAIRNPNGYTHALNCAIYKQLRDIYDLLQRPTVPEGTPTIRLNGLKQLVETLQDVLAMDQTGTRAKLIEHFREKESARGIIGDARQYAFNKANDAAVDAITKVISSAYESFMRQDQLEEQLFNIFGQLNLIYARDAEVNPREYQAAEEGIHEMIDKIVTSFVDDKLRTTFAPPAQDGTKLKENYIAELRGYMPQITALGQNVNRISFTSDLDADILAQNLAHFNNLIRQIPPLEASIALTNRRIEDTPPNVLGAADKRRLSEEFAEPLNQHLNRLKDALVQAHRRQLQIQMAQTQLLPQLDTVLNAIQAVNDAAQGEGFDSREMMRQIQLGQSNLFRVCEFSTYQPHAAAYREEFAKINQGFTTLQQGDLTVNILSHFGSRAAQMLRAEPRSAERAQMIESMRADLNRLPNEQQKQTLLASFGDLCGANEAQRNDQLISFTALNNLVLQHAREQILIGKERLVTVTEALYRVLKTKEDEENLSFRAENTQVPQDGVSIRRAISAIPAWAANNLALSTLLSNSSNLGWALRTAGSLAIPAISYYTGYTDLLSMGLNVATQLYLWRNEARGSLGYVANMNGVHDRIQDVALGVIRKESEAALSFIRKPHNYRHGVFNHLLFIPFVQA